MSLALAIVLAAALVALALVLIIRPELLRPLLTRPVRDWLYTIALAAVVVVMAYGLLSGDKAAAWLGLIAALLGMAKGNVPDSPRSPEPLPERAIPDGLRVDPDGETYADSRNSDA